MNITTEDTKTLTIQSNQSAEDAYIRQIHQYPRLTIEEERELVKLKEHGDLDATQKLILSNLPFVVYIANQYRGYNLPIADLIQEGNIGLMKGVKRVSSDHKTKLTTYAVHHIRAEIMEYVIKNVQIAKVATTKSQRKLFFNLRSATTTHNHSFKTDEIDALAEKFNVRPSDVRDMEFRLCPASTTLSDGESLDTLDTIVGNTLDGELLLDCGGDIVAHNITALQKELQTLTHQERDIIERRWLSDEKTILGKLAEEYNISAERIRQIEKKAISKLRKSLGGNESLRLS